MHKHTFGTFIKNLLTNLHIIIIILKIQNENKVVYMM